MARCAEGDLPPNVALAQLFMSAGDLVEAEGMLAHMLDYIATRHPAGAARLRSVRDLWRATPGAFATVKAITAAVDHDDEERGNNTAHWAQAFDRTVDISAAGGVALYSLGRTDLLAAITGELIDLMRRWNLLSRKSNLLDLGCGNGRVLEVVAPMTRLAVGIDVSSRMLDSARRRCPASADLIRSSGRDLALFASTSFDVICAVDVFPYLFASGLSQPHFHEAARVLKPGGHLIIFNYSYRGSNAADRAEVAELAKAAGFGLPCNGTREFNLWDGLTFLLQKNLTRAFSHGAAPRRINRG
ncbi:MAG TPA: class I SAM-dependent methyltransferase [Xanthobacteraceae bacterium]|nr:class I SAM-dependent methyltransferase [Xanthobacteraceae bacterium]